ncbi:hypothetical protein T265_06329 [Opisthorchis viverrini]|uniref:Uncharacterized protein n=1 Tax=Opisthorchis viverrini TaxID=6198 RepID=A0A074ZGS0_OPIVI|nr:hypothetical protein T265_06329 [Opisthorchis viverrini]KER26408.1 hypothetical protein T265_06329 [Opisthorchis viverrini]
MPLGRRLSIMRHNRHEETGPYNGVAVCVPRRPIELYWGVSARYSQSLSYQAGTLAFAHRRWSATQATTLPNPLGCLSKDTVAPDNLSSMREDDSGKKCYELETRLDESYESTWGQPKLYLTLNMQKLALLTL